MNTRIFLSGRSVSGYSPLSVTPVHVTEVAADGLLDSFKERAGPVRKTTNVIKGWNLQS